MKVGIGLPNVVAGNAAGALLIEWARFAESAGFSTLASLGRVAWPAYEELVSLSAAAGATSRIQLSTNILLGPTREPVLLATQAATLDQISGGRFVLGVGVGSREDDYRLAGSEFSNRGRRWDSALELMHQVWRGELVRGSARPAGPRPLNGRNVPMMFGGRTERAILRAARWGIGYTQGSALPETLPSVKAQLEKAWEGFGRSGQPYYRAATYFVLGPEPERGRGFIASHYGSYAGGFADKIWGMTPTGATAVKQAIESYEAAGWDELILLPTIPELKQAELLAGAAMA